MKNRWLIFLIALWIICSNVMCFAQVMNDECEQRLTISGTTIICRSIVEKDNANLSLIMKLYQDGRVVKNWYDSGQDRVSLSETYSGRSGSTYKLSVTYTVDGTRYNMPTITKVCP